MESLKKALVLFASISYETEILVHKEADCSDPDAMRRWRDEKNRLNAMERTAADLVEEISGSRPEFFDQGGFFDGGLGVISFTYAGLEFNYDGKEITMA